MTTASPDLIDWEERQYISQYSQPPLTLSIYIAGQPADPDGSSVNAQLFLQNPDGTVSAVNTYTAVRENAGVYTVTPSSADTAIPADAELAWSYVISGQPEQYATLLVIGRANPYYDALPQAMQDLLELVWVRFADIVDSPSGGPNLQAYYQAHWSRGRMAQLMAVALAKINSIAQPWSNYTLNGASGALFPTAQWGGLLQQYTLVEAVKHLIRSYTEQPEAQGVQAARLDRRDYSDRWRQVLADETAELRSLLDVFKIRHLGLGNPKVLVSGGTYGRYAPTRIAGSVAARPRMWARWRSGTNRTGGADCLHALPLPCSTWPGPAQRGTALRYPATPPPHPAQPCHASPRSAMPSQATPCPCPALPCHTMPGHAMPGIALSLPCPARPCAARRYHASPRPCPAVHGPARRRPA
jgi:hypothetical protein